MSAIFQSNSNTDASQFDIDVTIDEDDGLFLSLTVENVINGRTVLEAFAASPAEIKEFFHVVREAEKDYLARSSH